MRRQTSRRQGRPQSQVRADATAPNGMNSVLIVDTIYHLRKSHLVSSAIQALRVVQSSPAPTGGPLNLTSTVSTLSLDSPHVFDTALHQSDARQQFFGLQTNATSQSSRLSLVLSLVERPRRLNNIRERTPNLHPRDDVAILPLMNC
jgi:hypothetical protein